MGPKSTNGETVQGKIFEGERGKWGKVFERCTTCLQIWVYTGLAEQDSVSRARHRESGCVGIETEWMSDDPELDALMHKFDREEQDRLDEMDRERGGHWVRQEGDGA